MAGQHVPAVAGGDLAHGDDQRVERIVHPGDQLLDGLENGACHHHGVHTLVRGGSVGGLALHLNGEAVAAGHEVTGGESDTRGVIGTPDMHAVNGVHTVQRVFLHHPQSAHGGLLRRLEHQAHVAGKLVLHLVEDLGGAQQHGHVIVMAAGMHLALVVGCEGQAGLLLDRQSINIGAQRHGLARLAAVNGGGQAVAGLHLVNVGDAQCLQIFLQMGAGVLLLAGELRAGVIIPTAIDDVIIVLFRKRFDIHNIHDPFCIQSDSFIVAVFSECARLIL